jgi:dienelactone hydrolase
VGSAADVSSLIDFLPSFLYPKRERHIAQWGVIGVSLGGHIVWLLLANELRLTLGASVIGCPSYTKLIRNRAGKCGLAIAAPHVPPTLLELVEKTSAEAVPWSSLDPKNSFLTKKILIIAGGRDQLVPWSDSADFVQALVVGDAGIKKVYIHPDVGHKFTPQMLEETAQFIATNGRLPSAPSSDV